jgi:hypothetical protein
MRVCAFRRVVAGIGCVVSCCACPGAVSRAVCACVFVATDLVSPPLQTSPTTHFAGVTSPGINTAGQWVCACQLQPLRSSIKRCCSFLSPSLPRAVLLPTLSIHPVPTPSSTMSHTISDVHAHCPPPSTSLAVSCHGEAPHCQRLLVCCLLSALAAQLTITTAVRSDAPTTA